MQTDYVNIQLLNWLGCDCKEKNMEHQILSVHAYMCATSWQCLRSWVTTILIATYQGNLWWLGLFKWCNTFDTSSTSSRLPQQLWRCTDVCTISSSSKGAPPLSGPCFSVPVCMTTNWCPLFLWFSGLMLGAVLPDWHHSWSARDMQGHNNGVRLA